MLTNIRIERMGMEGANTLAYYDYATIAVVKSFIVLVTVSHFYPSLIFTAKTGAYQSLPEPTRVEPYWTPL